MEHRISLTLNEAGYVVGQSSVAINRAVDRGVIRAKLQRRGNIRLRKIGRPNSDTWPSPVRSRRISRRLPAARFMTPCDAYRPRRTVWRSGSLNSS